MSTDNNVHKHSIPYFSTVDSNVYTYIHTPFHISKIYALWTPLIIILHQIKHNQRVIININLCIECHNIRGYGSTLCRVAECWPTHSITFSTNWLSESSSSWYTCKEQQISSPEWLFSYRQRMKIRRAHCKLIKSVLFYDLRDTQTIEKHMQGAADFKSRTPHQHAICCRSEINKYGIFL